MAAVSDRSQQDTLTLFIILDAFRHDYLARAPYLTSLADWHGKVCEPFGFISTRPAMCAGVYPEQTNLCFEYQFRPDGDTFSPWLFHMLSACAKIVPERFVRLAATAWVRLMSRAQVVRSSALVGNLPFGSFPSFDYAEKLVQSDPHYLRFPTIYDLLRERGERFLYFGFARRKRPLEMARRIYSVLVKHDLFEADRTMVQQFKKALPKVRPSFAHLHFSACDWVGHKYGPDSVEIEKAIHVIDEQIREVLSSVRQHYREVRLLISADHGMVPVHKAHNLDEILRNLPFREREDYLVFRDSTMARFWFFCPESMHAIRKELQSIPWGRIMEGPDREKFRIRFSDNSNGDLLFLLDAGHVLLPNYYQAAGAPPLGMHGYDPSVLDNQGAILIHNPAIPPATRPGETLQMADVFPMLLRLHGLPCPTGSSPHSVFAAD